MISSARFVRPSRAALAAALLALAVRADARPSGAAASAFPQHSRSVAIISGYHWGYRDPRGRFVLSPHLPPGFDWGYNEGLAPVEVGGKRGYIGQSRRLEIPARYEEAGRFSEGLAAVRLHGKVGFIDAKGRLVIRPRFQNAGAFAQGLAPVELSG